MEPLIILLVAGLILGAAMKWHRLGDPVEEPEIVKIQREKEIRRERMSLLNRAYLLAKEELGEEPTIDQVLLTRDQLLTQEALDNGETG